MIGIGITTHNRRATALHAIAEIKRLAPAGAKIVIVDDASEIPFPGASYRFEKQAGIARVKNKCLEMLEGCEHIFLFDDDVYPIVDKWWIPYTGSGLNHLCFTFNREKKHIHKSIYDYQVYGLPCGCMLYFTGRCLKIAGGFDTAFEGYGYEHVNLSQRIYNNGLTVSPYMDYVDSLKLFYSHDYHKNILPSTTGRGTSIPINKALFEAHGNSKEFKAYK